MLMDSRLVHCGGANLCDSDGGARRRVLVVTFAVPETAPTGSSYSIRDELKGRWHLRDFLSAGHEDHFSQKINDEALASLVHPNDFKVRLLVKQAVEDECNDVREAAEEAIFKLDTVGCATARSALLSVLTDSKKSQSVKQRAFEVFKRIVEPGDTLTLNIAHACFSG